MERRGGNRQERKRQPKLPFPLKAPDSAHPRQWSARYGDVDFAAAAAGGVVAVFEP